MGNSGRSREPHPEGPGLRFFFPWELIGRLGVEMVVWRTIRDFEGKGYSATFTDVRILICPCWGAGGWGLSWPSWSIQIPSHLP